mmetsp:Transcript_11806/g.25519  ORF Transcript_11806/g.25519 Transcript_11806/m.25519 type:complete len:583 (+) Transcript_11806:154-1902(+)
MPPLKQRLLEPRPIRLMLVPKTIQLPRSISASRSELVGAVGNHANGKSRLFSIGDRSAGRPIARELLAQIRSDIVQSDGTLRIGHQVFHLQPLQEDRRVLLEEGFAIGRGGVLVEERAEGTHLHEFLQLRIERYGEDGFQIRLSCFVLFRECRRCLVQRLQFLPGRCSIVPQKGFRFRLRANPGPELLGLIRVDGAFRKEGFACSFFVHRAGVGVRIKGGHIILNPSIKFALPISIPNLVGTGNIPLPPHLQLIQNGCHLLIHIITIGSCFLLRFLLLFLLIIKLPRRTIVVIIQFAQARQQLVDALFRRVGFLIGQQPIVQISRELASPTARGPRSTLPERLGKQRLPHHHDIPHPIHQTGLVLPSGQRRIPLHSLDVRIRSSPLQHLLPRQLLHLQDLPRDPVIERRGRADGPSTVGNGAKTGRPYVQRADGAGTIVEDGRQGGGIVLVLGIVVGDAAAPLTLRRGRLLARSPIRDLLRGLPSLPSIFPRFLPQQSFHRFDALLLGDGTAILRIAVVVVPGGRCHPHHDLLLFQRERVRVLDQHALPSHRRRQRTRTQEFALRGTARLLPRLLGGIRPQQ